MISQQDRLTTRIETCLSLDKADPTVLRVEMDRVVHYLHEYGYPVAPTGFEAYITKFLDKNVVGKVPLGDKSSFTVIALMILKAAEIYLYEGTKEAKPDEPEQFRKMIEEWEHKKHDRDK